MSFPKFPEAKPDHLVSVAICCSPSIWVSCPSSFYHYQYVLLETKWMQLLYKIQAGAVLNQRHQPGHFFRSWVDGSNEWAGLFTCLRQWPPKYNQIMLHTTVGVKHLKPKAHTGCNAYIIHSFMTSCVHKTTTTTNESSWFTGKQILRKQNIEEKVMLAA